MRSLVLVSGCILFASAISCTGPERTFVDPVASSGGGSTSSGGGAGGDATTSTSTSTSTTTTGAGGSSACSDSTHVCIEKAPAGWVGPIALYQGDGAASAPPCAGAYPTVAADYEGDLDEGNPVCDCACAPAAGIVCSASLQLCYPGSGANACIQVCQNTKTNLPPGQCVAIPYNASTNVSLSNPSPTQVGSCAPMATKTIPAPTWGTAARACAGAITSDEGCADGETCAPAAVAPFDSLCVVSPGDVPCPDAFYSNKHVFYDGFTDTRDCSACSCGGATSTCGGQVSFQHSNNGPCAQSNVISDGSNDAGTCGGYFSGFDSGTYNPSPSGSCPPSGGALTGSVTTSGASTVCCH